MDPAPTPDLVHPLEMTAVSKRFGQSLVLDEVDFRVARGRIHGLVGHNGAGKSTLMKIALGGVAPTSGTVLIGGQRLSYARPAAARDLGVGMVLQELSLIPTLSVADNIFLNDEQRTPVRTIRLGRQRREARRLLESLGITSISPSVEVGSLGIAEQQMVEIAKAVRLTRELLILDEPTAPLSRQEVVRLFELVRRTAQRGIGVVFITHHLREVFELCDEITVLREGRVVLAKPIAETSLDSVVTAIVGSDLAAVSAVAAPAVKPTVEPLMKVSGLTVRGKLRDISFELFPGEILGIAGLAGSGRTVLLKSLFGEIRPESGAVQLGGADYRPSTPARAIEAGVYLIPEDRRVHGVVLIHSIEDNIVLSILGRITRWGLWRPLIARATALRLMAMLEVKATSRGQAVGELSGGNQQKVVMSKALAAEPTVFLLDEPTFGVDVHTAAEVIHRIRLECESGKAAIWVSSDLPELLTVSDRVLVLADGTVKAVLDRASRDFTEEALLRSIQRAEPGSRATAGAALEVAQ
jgi:ribose transport system ATP-binding protein